MSNFPLTVCGPRVLISIPNPNKTHKVAGSQIELALVLNEDRERSATTIGRVVSIGATAFKDDQGDGTEWYKVGDMVYFGKYAGKFITNPKNKNEWYVCLNYEDVLGVLPEDETVTDGEEGLEG